jgi:26S proteasome regulatory subunit T5
MSTLEDLDDLERDGKKEEEQEDKNQKADGAGDADMKDADEKKKEI